VVHHVLCAVIGPLFERGFIGNTFANRAGKGTHRAIGAYEGYRDRHACVLRCDLFRYFPSIDHAILKAEFRRRIACASTLALIDAIVDGSNAQEPVELHFPGDDLFEPQRRRRGLPIGNLTSQFFANLYLDGFDHFVSEVLRAPYVRYVDDFALFHNDAAVLAQWRARIGRYLEGRRVKLHPRKTAILATAQPSAFLGFVLLPGGGRRLPEDNVARFRNRLRGLRDRWRAGAPAPSAAPRSKRKWGRGSPMRRMRTPGGCGRRCWAAGGSGRGHGGEVALDLCTQLMARASQPGLIEVKFIRALWIQSVRQCSRVSFHTPMPMVISASCFVGRLIC
jgi:RNA-directed DNA polymerase